MTPLPLVDGRQCGGYDSKGLQNPVEFKGFISRERDGYFIGCFRVSRAMDRVLEPELMDSPEDAVDYDRMDHSEVNRRFVNDLLECEPDLSETLDIGTGTAQIPIELCGRLEDVRVVALDMAASMLHQAYVNIELAGLRERVRLDQQDAKQLEYDDGSFTTVMSNSIVHHVPEPIAVLREAWRVARPGGLVFFRDLVRPGDEAELERLVDTYAADCNDRQRQLFADSLRAALSLAEVRERVADIGGNPARISLTSDRHWTWSERRSG